jgi:hypothetical protein
MRIQVKVKARAKQTSVEKLAEGQYKVKVKEVPEKGKANHAVIAALSDFLGVPQARIALVGGATSSNKLFDIS